MVEKTKMQKSKSSKKGKSKKGMKFTVMPSKVKTEE
jgi:hypothetical protein